MSYTRTQWAEALLHAIGNTPIQQRTVEFIVAWTEFETAAPPGAAFNLLNTTEPNTPGVVGNFNSAGVKNYDTFAHGILANAKVLANGRYPILYNCLRQNLPFVAVEQINAELSVWGTGPKLASILARMGTADVQQFPGQADNTEWARYLPGLKSDTGIYHSWLQKRAEAGPPLTPEIEIQPHAMLVVQEFERATCFWIDGHAHWRIYP